MQLGLFTLDYDQIKQVVKENGMGRYLLVYSDGKKEIRCLSIGSSGSLLKMCEKSKRYGYYFYLLMLVILTCLKSLKNF
jgi:hypothetical protein